VSRPPADPVRVEASALTKRFRRDHAAPVTVLDGLDLSLAAGELVVVTGPSLSGKTTLVDLLAGWARPDKGRVVWNGASTQTPPWSYLTVVPQGFALVGELTVAENIDMAARFDRGGDAGRADRLAALLGRLGLDRLQDRGAFEISVGERQRTMVARALVDRPRVVLADEPVAHQDQRHAEVVLELLREAIDAGAAGLVATRAPDLVTTADRIVTLGTAD
jgi:putative ABC transport system ATP-binding protein